LKREKGGWVIRQDSAPEGGRARERETRREKGPKWRRELAREIEEREKRLGE